MAFAHILALMLHAKLSTMLAAKKAAATALKIPSEGISQAATTWHLLAEVTEDADLPDICHTSANWAKGEQCLALEIMIKSRVHKLGLVAHCHQRTL